MFLLDYACLFLMKMNNENKKHLRRNVYQRDDGVVVVDNMSTHDIAKTDEADNNPEKIPRIGGAVKVTVPISTLPRIPKAASRGPSLVSCSSTCHAG